MRSINFKNPIIALPYPYYFWPVIITTMAGLLDSVYLAASHYRNYADMGYKSFCAISSAINCDTVAQSQYSIFLNVPVSIWGIMAHAFFSGSAVVCISRDQRPEKDVDIADGHCPCFFYLLSYPGSHISISYSQLLHHVHTWICDLFSAALLFVADPKSVWQVKKYLRPSGWISSI